MNQQYNFEEAHLITYSKGQKQLSTEKDRNLLDCYNCRTALRDPALARHLLELTLNVFSLIRVMVQQTYIF